MTGRSISIYSTLACFPSLKCFGRDSLHNVRPLYLGLVDGKPATAGHSPNRDVVRCKLLHTVRSTLI